MSYTQVTPHKAHQCESQSPGVSREEPTIVRLGPGHEDHGETLPGPPKEG